MFNGQGNSKDDSNKLNVNTRGLQLFNVDGFCPSTVQLGYWNNSMLSIKLHPAKEKSQQTEKEKFDYDQVVNTAITIEKATALLSKIPVIKQAFAEGKNANASIEVSGNNLVTIGTQSINGANVYFFGVHKELSEKRIPKFSMYYQFRTVDVIDNYDPKSGEFDKSKAESEFDLFVNYIKAVVSTSGLAVAHSMRVIDNYYRTRMEDKLNSLCTANGIDTGYKQGGGYSRRGGGSNLFNKSAQASNTDGFEGAPVEEVNNIEDLPF